ncbi:MFS transporter [Pseudonocardia hydrocarbonoxydans]|uniref:Putative transporter n=1 Tax=Pseudonocardia hydrocarbonoxydans TaxID=76726 RepID=A0A4Y3WID1_9PSEU|nr:MFS transporter [Pseudonocardia hydrocarbonoxydans]GEC18687.1 putative transporter [Pseudonocardia hydrocarbonoxydans]
MVEVDASRAPVRIPREIWVLVGASFLIAIGFGLVAPTLPVFVRTFDVGITAAGLVVSVFALARLVFAPSSGWLVTRVGELRVFNAGLLIVAVSTAAMAFAGEYWHLIALRAFGGIGSTMFTISAVSLLIRLAPPEIRGRASGMWATGFLLGNIVGPLAGGGLVAISLRAPFLVYAAVLVVVVLVSGVLLRGRLDVAPPVPGAPPVVAVGFREALGHRAYRAALVANFGVGWAVFGARVALVPLFVVEALGQPEAWSGVVLAVFAAGNAATLVVAGRFADRFGRRPPMLLGLAVAALATGMLGYVEQPWVVLAVSLVAGLGSGMVNPPLQASVGDVIGTGGRGGTVLAGFQMASDLGAILGPVLAGGLAELVGYGWAFAITGGVLAVAWLFWLRAPETLPARTPTTRPR